MPVFISKYLVRLLVIASLLAALPAGATHIVGGEVTYRYMGSNQYEITLTIYEDCLNGTQAAIAADNPAFIGIYDGLNNLIYSDSLFYTTSIFVPANFSNACVTNVPKVCLQKRSFVKDYYLPPNITGYVFTYQRCCRNAALVNVESPSLIGATYYCTIPPALVVGTNNSAVFNNYPPQIICVNTPLVYNHSATDPDGDSLSYELCNSIMADDDNSLTNSIPPPPPYANVSYITPPFSYSSPMIASPAVQIDPTTGIITGTPIHVGRYLVTVCCHEWRNGVMINTIRREFQFVVTNCTKLVVADIPVLSPFPNTYLQNCIDSTIHFRNTSIGGITWNWYFGAPTATVDTGFEPTFVYPDTGTFTVKLVVNPGTNCTDSILRSVRIYPTFHAAFSDSGNFCPASTVSFINNTSSTVQPVTYWKWFFGDGDSSFQQSPTHQYLNAGTYNTMFITQNSKECIDTSVGQVIIDNFRAFAGNDTLIVKGEKIQFNAMGGTEYSWSPPACLSDTSVHDPIGYYPDTGRFIYYVHITSAYGCTGYDTMKVTVVNQAEFFVPTAFTPDGDGHNDIFRPIAAGYSGIAYFRVFNRWGQRVYNGTSLDQGWDGTFNNARCDLGTYFWEISFTDRFGKQGSLQGDVLLIR